MTTIAVHYELVNNSIVFPAKVNGEEIRFILDTGDAVGPVFNSADAQRLGLKAEGAEGVEGAGGASQIYQSQATVQVSIYAWDNEPCAIDPNLQGYSLLGLPFFLKKVNQLAIDIPTTMLVLFGAENTGRQTDD